MENAWKLFDRSVTSAFSPDGTPIVLDLEHAEQMSAFKVFGPSPYRVDVRGRDGTSLGFEPIDLTGLDRGWHIFPSSALVGTNRVELRFTPTGMPGAIPELELWAQVDELPPPASKTFARIGHVPAVSFKCPRSQLGTKSTSAK